MAKKYTYEFVKEYIEKLGFELISEEYINYTTKLIYKDSQNYYYKQSFQTIIRGGVISKFDSRNFYVIQNINNWILTESSKNSPTS